MADRKLLLVSYLFPPAGGVPVQRALSLARYLPETGYEVQVLCCRNPGIPNLDPSLLERIPPHVRVHRTWSPELSFQARQRVWGLLAPKKKAPPAASPAPAPKEGRKPSLLKRIVPEIMRRIYCPDPEVVWLLTALPKARRLIREEGIDTILITSPPYSSLLLGLRLKREFPHLKFIVDYRDEWLDYYLNAFEFYRSPYIQSRARRMEREIAEAASLMVAMTPTIQQLLRQRYADLPAAKFAMIRNGYDPKVLEGFRARPHGSGRIVISYAGTLHGTSSPRPYFEALDRLPPEIGQHVETRLIGRVTEEQTVHLRDRKYPIRQYGFLPQEEAFRILEETDYLLLIQGHAGSLSGKLYEYLAMGKPILAITSDSGETPAVLKETRSGVSADPAKPGAVDQMLAQAIQAALEGRSICNPDRAAVEQFSRLRLAFQYAEAIRSSRP